MAQIALVTGASRGIGKATAVRLVKLGYHVIAQHRAGNPDFSEVEAAASERGVKVTPVQADFSDPQSVSALLTYVKDALGGDTLDVAVLNAGVGTQGTFQELNGEALRSLLQINTVAPYELAAGLVPLMSAPGGRYVFTGSVLTRYAFPAMTGYGMSKIALEYLVRNMAVELGPQGITVNLVAPGVVDTDINAAWLRNNAEAAEFVKSGNAMKKVTQPEDVAEVIGLLTQNASQTITGQIIDVSMGDKL